MYKPNLLSVTHPTRVTVIGCGYWGMNHIRVLNELPDAEVAVCDSRTGRLDEVARRFPEVMLTDDIEEALEDQDLDAVVVCTPAATHHEVASLALRAHKRPRRRSPSRCPSPRPTT